MRNGPENLRTTSIKDVHRINNVICVFSTTYWVSHGKPFFIVNRNNFSLYRTYLSNSFHPIRLCPSDKQSCFGTSLHPLRWELHFILFDGSVIACIQFFFPPTYCNMNPLRNSTKLLYCVGVHVQQSRAS
jgi:hypothetical protein